LNLSSKSVSTPANRNFDTRGRESTIDSKQATAITQLFIQYILHKANKKLKKVVG
jgi:hypothetical protein